MKEEGEIDSAERWRDLRLLLERSGPFAHSAFEPDNDTAETRSYLAQCRVLVIGAGGLGCELLKDLALSGFARLDVIDMDTIDVTNLNRQFLFRPADVGRPKAVAAAAAIERRIPGVTVTPHYANITTLDEEFYRQFSVVVAGLDSIDARRWLNALLVGLLDRDPDTNEVDPSSVIPLVDGGTEGFLGQARLIIPGFNACFECTLSLFPPQRNFPLCTIANTPRLPEHCIEYAQLVLWSSGNPFGQATAFDADNSEHVQWVFNQAKTRAATYGIRGVTYRLTQGVVKNIIPAVASTNAIIAAACTNEALKIVTNIAPSIDNYMMYNGHRGVYTYTYQNQRRPDCPVCGDDQRPLMMQVDLTKTLEDLLVLLAEDAQLQLRKPGLRLESGKSLYFSAPPQLEKMTHANLKISLQDLIGDSSPMIIVSDPSLPNLRRLQLVNTS